MSKDLIDLGGCEAEMLDAAAPSLAVEMAAGSRTAELKIYGMIGGGFWTEGVSASGVVRMIDNLPSGVDTLRVRIHSPGGSVPEASAIYNALVRAKQKVVTVIEGWALSAATVVAMAGDEIEMAELAMFMIHNPMTLVQRGTAEQLRQNADVLDRIRDQVVQLYAKRSGGDPADIMAMMKAETYMTADKAKEKGFVDTILPGKTKLAAPKGAAALTRMYRRFGEFLSLDEQEPIMAGENAGGNDAAKIAAANETKRCRDIIGACNKACLPEMAEKFIDDGATLEVVNAKLVDALAEKQNAAPPAGGDSTLNGSAAGAPGAAGGANPPADPQAAAEAERVRCRSIMAVCKKSGHPELADKFIDEGATLEVVNGKLLEAMCERNKPLGEDAGGVGAGAGATASGGGKKDDPEAIAKAEYAAQKALMQSYGVSEADYVRSRKITLEGLGGKPGTHPVPQELRPTAGAAA